ncbi:MAG TPA: transglycosylase SLT domain-containing protein [Polyangiaceae bacterium]|jgi:membrane-bound lytic murein transglycosylase D|nr:transglycosylase SLT domain-containing protein [Polyangiaceae bacterium]
MSFVEKIPPLISALAFGYGVGMAAPDIAVDKVQGAVAGYQAAGQAKIKDAAPAPALSVALEKKLPGDESPLLAELRATRGMSRYGEGGRDYGGDARFDRGIARFDQSAQKFYDQDLAAEADDFEATESAAISRLQLPDLGLGVSRQTLKYVRFFTKTDRGRGMFETWLKRSGRYQELVQEELRGRNLPEDLIWVAMIESGFDPTAKSPVGAVGLWQFMPTTGAVYGLRQNKFVDQRRNPRLATQAAAHHLRDLYLRFGQWDLALAAYNMGYEQLLDRMDRVGTTDFNELVRAGALPEETAKYVPKIVAAAIVANNLERFGFDDVEIARPNDVGEIAVPPRTPLEVVAKAAGVSTSVIRKLNPDLLSKELPPGRGDFLVNVPADTVSRSIAAMPAMLQREQGLDRGGDDVLDPVDMMSPEGYRPRVADSDGASDDASLLSLLPKPKKKRRSLRSPVDDDSTDDRVDDLASMDRRLKDERDEARSNRETLVYKVGSGDTLAGVAREFAADVEDVARDNGLKVDAKIKEGAILKVKVRKDVLDLGLRKSGTADERDGSPAKKPNKG